MTNDWLKHPLPKDHALPPYHSSHAEEVTVNCRRGRILWLSSARVRERSLFTSITVDCGVAFRAWWISFFTISFLGLMEIIAANAAQTLSASLFSCVATIIESLFLWMRTQGNFACLLTRLPAWNWVYNNCHHRCLIIYINFSLM